MKKEKWDNPRPSWDEYFLNICKAVSLRSHDENTKVGCVITDKRHRIVSTGYNGFPCGVDDDMLPSNREDSIEIETDKGIELITKYDVMTHAEANAIASSKFSIEGGTLYVNLFPCNDCAKLIITAGIRKVVYKEKRNDKLQNLSHMLFKQAGIEMKKV
jgi:dCMP deaminase